MKLKGMRALLDRLRRAATATHGIAGSASPHSPGYFLPQSAVSLMATPARQRCLQQIWENCALPAELYQQLYFTPLVQLLLRVQNVPAAIAGPWAGEGGYGDMVMRYVACAVRLTRAHLLPPGEPPEVQAVQGGLWQAVVFWLALCHHLPLLVQFRGECISGEPWIPGMNEPREPYRFAVNPTPSAVHQMHSLAALQAGQLLPLAATRWLSTAPAALDCLAQRLSGFSSPLAVVDQILETAVETSGAVSMPLRGPADQTAVTSFPWRGLTAVGTATDRSLTGSAMRDTIRPSPARTDRDRASLQVPSPAPASQSGEMVAAVSAGVKPFRPIVDPGGPSLAALETETCCDRRGVSDPTDVISPPGARGDDPQEGHTFWQWLRAGLRDGSLPVNDPGGGLQLVKGYLLIPVPSTFFLYLKRTGRNGGERAKVQQGFDRLRCYKGQGKGRFYTARLYASGDGLGPFTSLNGYLVKACLLFDVVPPDSPYLVMA